MTKHVNQMSARELRGVSLPGDFVPIGKRGSIPEMQDVIVSSITPEDRDRGKPKSKHLSLTICVPWDWIDLSERFL